MPTINITHSKAKFLTKEEVQKHKSKYFVTIEEHEQLYRAKETWKAEHLLSLKLKNNVSKRSE